MKNRRSLDYDGLDGVLLSTDGCRTQWYQSPWFLLVICALLLGLLLFQTLNQQLPAEITAAQPPQAGLAHTDQAEAAKNTDAPAAENIPASLPSPENATGLSQAVDTQAAGEVPVAHEQETRPVIEPAAKPIFSVNFKLASSKLGTLNPEQAQALIDAAQSCSDKIQLTGHTCSLGTDQRNRKLGLARAKAVENWLVAKDIPRHRIVSVSEGMYRPVAPNDTQMGQALNRRTELACLDQSSTRQD